MVLAANSLEGAAGRSRLRRSGSYAKRSLTTRPLWSQRARLAVACRSKFARDGRGQPSVQAGAFPACALLGGAVHIPRHAQEHLAAVAGHRLGDIKLRAAPSFGPVGPRILEKSDRLLPRGTSRHAPRTLRDL